MTISDLPAGWIVPEWPAPAAVKAVSTSRQGGSSQPPYEWLNLGDHVGDCAQRVAENRHRLVQALQLPAPPIWLNQVHGVDVVEASQVLNTPAADASYTRKPGVVCCVMTADCLPLLLCDRGGQVVAALHAGWRGLADGVIEACVARMGRPAAELMAWLGPAIGPRAFEVGGEVRQRFLACDPAAAAAFEPTLAGRWLADIYLLARQRLQRAGVEEVYGGQRCTYEERDHFFSYRRDGVTGRMASLIWIGSRY